MTPQLHIDSICTEKSAQRLAEEFPTEIAFYCKAFVWSSHRHGFYTREGYYAEPHRPAWQPYKRWNGDWQHFYPKLVADLVEKHLDLDRFYANADPLSRSRLSRFQTAFWFGTMAGEKTLADCIDVDSHDVIGWYGVPTRWHESRNPDNPLGVRLELDHRFVPVVRLSLDYFQRLKRFHDHFPGRIWAFSSANLGLGLWRMLPRPMNTQRIYDSLDNSLHLVGLGGTEHYPRPPSSESTKGKVHRRPCGMDSGIITDLGLVTDPIEQIRLFMAPPPTPDFSIICRTILTKLRDMYGNWLAWDEFDCLNTIPKNERPAKGSELADELEQIIDWLNSGCPSVDARTSVVTTKKKAKKSRGETPLLPEGQKGLVSTVDEERIEREHGHAPDIFRSVDLRAIDDSGQWVQFCVFLAEHGFPCHDRFVEVISTLTRWLAFYELFDVWPDRTRIKDLLKSFCLAKNNGFITRFAQGKTEEVLAHVDRVVDDTIDSVSPEGKQVFAEMRFKRDSGCYPSVYRLSSLLEGESSSLSPILCGGLISPSTESEWVYTPDDSPLPESISANIIEAFRTANRQLRRAKDGQYLTLQAIGRLINYLYAGKNPGHRRASQQLLVQMGFSQKTCRRQAIKKVLSKAGILQEGDYQAQRKSRLYSLSKEVISLLDQDRQVNKVVA